MAKTKKNVSKSYIIKTDGGDNSHYLLNVKKESKQAEDKANQFTISPPYAFTDLADIYELNTYHLRCCNLKAALTCLLGFTITTDDDSKEQDQEYKKIKEFLDGHAVYSGIPFLETLYNFCLDQEIFANSFFEIVRNGKREIAEFYHLPTKNCLLSGKRENLILQQSISGDTAKFKNFNPKENADEKNNEFLQMKNYSPKSTFYGVPEYIGALGTLAMDRAAVEFNIRRFDNNMVIEQIISLIGGKFSKETHEDIKNFFTNNFKGVKNVGRSIILEFEEATPDSTKIQVDKIAAEIKDASFRGMRTDNKEEIVAAHGVPPRLVGIINSGSMGAGGESLNQLRIFRDTTIQPRQNKLEFLLNDIILKNAIDPKKWRVKFNSFDIKDAKDAADFYQKIMSIIDNNGEMVLDADEIREELKYPPRKTEQSKNKTEKVKIQKGSEFVKALLTIRKMLEESLVENNQNN